MSWNWIHPKYESLVASAFLVLGLLMPWSVAVQRPPLIKTAYNANWWFGQGLYIPDGRSGLVFVTDVVAAQATTPRTVVYGLWVLITIGLIAGCVITVLAISDANVGKSPPIHRVAGITLLSAGTGYTLVTLWLLMFGTPGLYIPVGAILMQIFGGLLITNRTANIRQLPLPSYT